MLAQLGQRARELVSRLAGASGGAWHPVRADRETMMELSERLDLDLPVDAFRFPEAASAFLRRALRSLDG